jgi:hypothetical protein
MMSHQAGNTVEATKSNGFVSQLATRIAWTLDARPFRQRGVYLFSMRLFNIAGRRSQLFTKRSQI